jgi:hypothetical protein
MLRALTILALALPAAAQSGDPVFADDFEDGVLGQPPAGWGYPADTPAAQVGDDGGGSGGRCACLLLDGRPFGNMIRTFPLGELRGQRVRFSARTIVEGAGHAQLWLRFDYDDGTSVLADNMFDRPVVEGDWEAPVLVADVADAPGTCVIGMMVFRGATAWLDDVRVEALGPTPSAAGDGPRALEERGLANLTAFARLLGYVRYFHPSDEVEAADWDAFAVRGVQRVEGAADTDALAAALREVFAPLAPTLQVQAAGAPAATHPALAGPPADERASVRAWLHHGLGLHASGPYRSWRTKKRVRDGVLPDGVPDPARPLELELAGGLVCRVPRALFATSAGTLPAATPPAPAPDASGLPPVTGALQSAWSAGARTTRLAAVILCWNVFQHFYPYFDEVEVDWPAELARALEAAATDADGAAFQLTLRRLVAALHDGHGAVYTLEQTSQGMLPLRWDHVEGALVVTAVAGDVDLALGDRVLSIGGEGALDAMAREEQLACGATPQWRRHVALQGLLTGPYEQAVELVVERDGAERRVALAYGWPDPPPSEPLPDPITEVQDDVWYVDLGRVTTEEFVALLPSLELAAGIVFDLREYPSELDAFEFFPHLIDEPVHSAWWKVPNVGGPDGTEREWIDSRWTIGPAAPRLTAKLAFLTGSGAISYAESCMAIVEHYRLGAIVGGPTAGTNGNVNPFELPGGYRVSWTGMKVVKHDGSRHHGVGIQPTIPVSRTRAGVAAGRDEVLEAGLAAVRGD